MPHNFSAIQTLLPCWSSAQFLPYSATFAEFPVGRKGLTSNGQCNNCYSDGEGRKRHAVTPVCVRSVARSIGYCRKMRCTTVPEIDRPTRGRSFLHPRTAPVSPVSRYRSDSQQWASIGFIHSYFILERRMNSPGSRKSLLLVMHSSNRCRYRTSVWESVAWHQSLVVK